MEAALAWLMERLDAQSHFMAKVIPAPPGATREVTLPSMEQLPEDLPMSRFVSLLGSPSAHGDLEVEGCQLVTDLSASPYALYEAREVHRWGRLHGKDGEVHNAFIRRNAERIVGDERVDGTGIEAVVDDNVVVRMVIPGNYPCDSDPEIVQRLFDEVLASDLSVFRVPNGAALDAGGS